LIEYSTSKFSVMDEIYILVDNYGPRATFEGKVARVKLQDIRKQEYLVTIDATEYPKLKLKFPQKLIEKIGDPEELRWAQKWGGHLWELAEELEYRLAYYERINFEFQILNKFSNFTVKESLNFNPVTGYISADLEDGGNRLEIDLDYQNGYPDVCPRAIINIRPDNPKLQSKINEILEKAANEWKPNSIFVRYLDEIAQAIFGKRMIRDLKTNKPLEGELYKCPECGGEFLKSSHDKTGEKFRCEYCYFGALQRKKERLIDDLLGRFEDA